MGTETERDRFVRLLFYAVVLLVEHGRLRFVLPSRMGHVELVGDVEPDAVRAALGA